MRSLLGKTVRFIKAVKKKELINIDFILNRISSYFRICNLFQQRFCLFKIDIKSVHGEKTLEQ